MSGIQVGGPGLALAEGDEHYADDS